MSTGTQFRLLDNLAFAEGGRRRPRRFVCQAAKLASPQTSLKSGLCIYIYIYIYIYIVAAPGGSRPRKSACLGREFRVLGLEPSTLPLTRASWAPQAVSDARTTVLYRCRSRMPAHEARNDPSSTGVGFFHTTTILQPYYNHTTTHTTTPYYNLFHCSFVDNVEVWKLNVLIIIKYIYLINASFQTSKLSTKLQ